ncbi:hypothetical protein, partial [Clavibacter lycopersici]|uniref:hypothetical protein n=1 Tax=Clavibacter lycopersici TaxID=2301718 RepID=UPI0018F2BEE6
MDQFRDQLSLPGVPATGSAPAGDPVAASDHYVRRQTVRFSAHMQRYGDVVVSIYVQGPNPDNGRPGWSRCVDLPQSGLNTWTEIGVQLLANARYTVSSYSDFACSRGANYRWTTGSVDTRWTHWIVYPIRSPHVTQTRPRMTVMRFRFRSATPDEP